MVLSFKKTTNMSINGIIQLVYDILNEDSEDNANYPRSLVRQLLLDTYTITNYVWYTSISSWMTLAYPQQTRKTTSTKYSAVTWYVWHDGTTLTVASTRNFGTSGVVLLAGVVVTYTDKTDTTFIGCSTIPWTLTELAGETIRGGIDINWRLLRIEYNNKDCDTYDNVKSNQAWNLPRYTQVWGYVFLQNEWVHKITTLPYPSIPNTDDEEIDILTHHVMYLVYLVAWEIMINRWQADEGAILQSQGMMKMKIYYQEIQTQYLTTYPNKQTPIYKWWINI